MVCKVRTCSLSLHFIANVLSVLPNHIRSVIISFVANAVKPPFSALSIPSQSVRCVQVDQLLNEQMNCISVSSAKLDVVLL